MLKKLFGKTSDYIEMKLSILRLNVIEKIALVMGFCMLMIFGIACVIAILILLGMGLSSYFADVTGSVSSGYFITTGIYLLLMALSMLFKKPLLRMFAGLFVNLLTDDIDEEAPGKH